jgi:ABC-type transporter Mla maintaining outer membrane lipid asymmetry ATPase subunit MlaF
VTASGGDVVLEIAGVTKAYSGLRPLRVASLRIAAGERVTVGGMDAGAGELLVNLVTGASLPDAGHIRTFGRLTSDIVDGDDWLTSLEQFGIVSARAVLLEGSTLLQNLAMPLTLEIEPVPDPVERDVIAIAARCGIDAARWLHARAGELPADMRVRAHLARSLVLEPRFLLIEHPTADVAPDARAALAADIARACADARLAVLVLSNDDDFAKAVAPRNLKLDGATGQLKPIAKGWFTW